MKQFLLPVLVVFGIQFPSLANPQAFKYKTPCYLEVGDKYLEDVCTVVETRQSGGALKTRNIFSNKFGLTVKSWFGDRGFMTWDSHNKFEYPWQYKVGNAGGTTASYVMPGFLLQDVSWD